MGSRLTSRFSARTAGPGTPRDERELEELQERDLPVGIRVNSLENLLPVQIAVVVLVKLDEQGVDLRARALAATRTNRADEVLGVDVIVQREAPEHVERLTERFYRVHMADARTRGGTGLGLAIVKHVLRRLHSKLVIESELGKGSTFSCEFEPHNNREANPLANLD